MTPVQPTGVEVGEQRKIPDVGTVREFCTDFDTTCWANCSCSLTLNVAPNTNTICMALAAFRNGMEQSMVLNANVLMPLAHGEAFDKRVLQVTVLMQALAFSEFAWLWISTKASPVCRVTVMQLNAKGPGCKPRGANCFHVLDSGKHVFRPRLPTTPSDHAFRPRFSATPSGHVFQPRLPATSSDVPFGSRTSCFSAELAVPLTFGDVPYG